MDGSLFHDSLTGELVSELRRTAAPIENLFLTVGEHLGVAAASLGTMTGLFGTLAARLEGDDLSRSISCLEKVGQGVASIGHNSTGSLMELERMDTLLGTIRSRLARLSKTISEVQLLSINARIESALVADSTVNFSVFTHEIGRLSSLAEQGLADLGEELSGLYTLVSTAREGQRRFEQAHRQSLGAVEERIARGLASSEAHRQEAATAIAAIAEEACRVGTRIGAVVLALQIGDITRQRVEHVCHALDGLDESADTGERGGRKRLAVVCGLQAAQLTQAAMDLEDSSRSAVADLAALTEEAQCIASIGTRVFGGSDRDHGSFLLELAEQMSAGEMLMQGYTKARADTDGLIHAVSGRVAAMVGHVEAVHSIEIDLRIMGLNATLKCNRLGTSGRALSVIAQTLRAYAGSTVADASELMTGLESVIATAHALGTSGHGGEAAPDLTDLVSTMQVSAELLDAAGTELATALASLMETIVAVRSKLDRSSACLLEYADITLGLRRVAERLKTIAGDLDMDDPEVQSLREQLLNQLDGDYTMAREREIHWRHTGGGVDVGVTSLPVASSAAEVSVDDLLF